MNHLDRVRCSFSAVIAPAIIASALLMALIGCGSEANGGAGGPGTGRAEHFGELTVVDPALDRPANPSVAAVWLEIYNGTADVVELVGVESPDGDASIHRSDVDDQGRSVMSPVDRLTVPARSSLVFESGGLHVMLNGITRDLEVGDTVDLSLEFEDRDPVEVEVPVVDPLASPGGNSDGGEHLHDHGALAPPPPPTSPHAGAF